jgi:H+/Cl- antiporter ClcA
MAQAYQEPLVSKCRVFFRMAFATLLQGVGSGVIGICVTILIARVQALGYGTSDGGFLEIADNTPPWRRCASVTFGGIFSAVAWYWLRGIDTIFVQVESCLKGEKMPPCMTLANGAIQDIAVALGGSFGREAAPREIAAMWGSVIADTLKVSERERKILVACGTGAGLAAVYSVPISGFFYTIEHVLSWDMSPSALIPAITTSCIAVLVSGYGVETDGLYHVPRYNKGGPTPSFLLWAVMIGPIVGLAAALFTKLIQHVREFRPKGRLPISFGDVSVGMQVRLHHKCDGETERMEATVIDAMPDVIVVRVRRPGCKDGGEVEEYLTRDEWERRFPEGQRDWGILIAMPVAFFLLGVLSLKCPSLLGNGRALAEVSVHRLEHGRGLGFLTMLIFLKISVTAAAIGSGVDGGTLTPSIAIGAAVGTVVSAAWQQTWSVGPPPADAITIIAAAGFLAAAIKSPVTGLWLMIELSGQGMYREEFVALARGDPDPLKKSNFEMGMLVPMMTAAFVATWTFRLVMYLHDALKEVALDTFTGTATDKSSVDVQESQPLRTPASGQSSVTLLRERSNSHDRGGMQDLDLGFEPTKPAMVTMRNSAQLRSIAEDAYIIDPNSVAA